MIGYLERPVGARAPPPHWQWATGVCAQCALPRPRPREALCTLHTRMHSVKRKF